MSKKIIASVMAILLIVDSSAPLHECKVVQTSITACAETYDDFEDKELDVETIVDKFEYYESKDDKDVVNGIYLSKYIGVNSKITIPETYDGYEVLGLSADFGQRDTTIEEVVFPNKKIDIKPGALLESSWQKNLTYEKNEVGIYHYKINDQNDYQIIFQPAALFGMWGVNHYELPDGTLIVGDYFLTTTLWDNKKGCFDFDQFDGKTVSILSGDSVSTAAGGGTTSYLLHGDFEDYDYLRDEKGNETYKHKETGKELTKQEYIEKFKQKTINIPDGVVFIDREAFCNPWGFPKYRLIEEFNFPSTLKGLESGWVFEIGETKDGIPFTCLSSLKEIKLPENLYYIGDGAFLSLFGAHQHDIDCCGISNDPNDYLKTYPHEVTIPASVGEIGKYAVGYYVISTGTEERENKYGDVGTYEIYEAQKIDGFTIKGYKNTAAEKYANDNGFVFEALDKKNDSRIADVNADGTIDIEDAVMIINHINGVKALTDEQFICSDVDGNGSIDIEDAVRIVNHINGVKAID